EDDLGSMMVDARKVKQIVYNLLSNAVKFTADGGQVTLRAAKVARACVGQLEARGNGSGRAFMPSENTLAEFLEIHVTDTGLGLAAQQPLSLITLDIALPKMDGWDFLTRIKQVPALRHVPVVIISILADFTKGFALGASAVMQKPVTRKELYESLAQLGLFVP